MNISIERAVPDDAEALTALQIAAFDDDYRLYPDDADGGPPGYDDVNATIKKITEDETYKIIVDGVIVGGAGVWLYSADHAHLDIMYVHPDYHGKGIGSKALEFLEATYPAKLWDLHTPVYATRNQHFYEKFGYVNVGEVTEPDGFRLIHYEKRV